MARWSDLRTLHGIDWYGKANVIMCGIIGGAAPRGFRRRDWLASGRDSMFHRGPDSYGEWWSADGCVGLAHRRLSILDVSSAGNQPMQEGESGLTVVFNGEIYNFRDLRRQLCNMGHRFSTQTDTEVILAGYREWGVDCLSRLNGAFAFALYDPESNKMFLARDRAGEKPLFYSTLNGTLRFASELKGLLSDASFPRKINADAFDCFLAMGYVPGDECIFSSVSKLPPAHAMTFNLRTGKQAVWRYWHVPFVPDAGTAPIAEADLIDELETLLASSVRRQLVADVPVGVLLSGGVDSSLITAMAARSADKIKTFTVRFSGYGDYDETRHARLIAKHFGTDHIELEADQTSVDILPELAYQFDEPVIDSSMIPTYLVSKLVRQHCTVALGGDGGDELFGGYSHYDRLLRMQRFAGKIPFSARRGIANTARRLWPIGAKGRNWLQALSVDLDKNVPLIATYFGESDRRRLLGDKFSSAERSAESIRAMRTPVDGDLLQRATLMDFENYLAEDILVKVDRASMMHSLEVRAPLLDQHLVEYAFGKLPSSLKATPDSRKILLKKLCARALPSGFDHQRKRGFSIPLASWLKNGPWREFFGDVLLGAESSLFNQAFVRHLVDGQDKGRNNSERLFGLAMFELWRREYGVAF